MSAYRTVTVICDECGTEIITDEFENLQHARRVAKTKTGMRQKRVANGSVWDYCSKCVNGMEMRNNEAN